MSCKGSLYIPTTRPFSCGGVRPVAVILAQFPVEQAQPSLVAICLEVQIKDSSFKQASDRATIPCAGAAMREPGPGAGAAPGMLLNMPSLQSTLQTRQSAAQAAQGAQAAQPLAGRSPSLDTWGATAGSPRAVDAQALSGFHSGSWVGAPPRQQLKCCADSCLQQLAISSVLQAPAAALILASSLSDTTAVHH